MVTIYVFLGLNCEANIYVFKSELIKSITNIKRTETKTAKVDL